MESVLKIGDKGDEVKKLQKLLNEKLNPIPLIKGDGVFGNITDKLVKKYQAIHNLGIDGVVGSKTWASLTGQAKPIISQIVVTSVNKASSWMEYAKKELNQKEIKGSTHNPRIITYHATTSLRADKDETP